MVSISFTVLLACVAGRAEELQPAPVSFRNDIAPILVKKCQTCHSPEKSKGGFQLHTFELLLKGGKSKEPSVVPGHPEQSKLYELLIAKDEDDRMPQKDDPLPAVQTALIERWIKEGAKFDGDDPKATLVTLVPRTPHPNPPEVYPRPVPVTALAFSPDGNELAASGYNEITIWDPVAGKLLRRIKNVAQRTQSLDYNPDGKLLAAASGLPGQLGEVALFDPASGALVKLLGAMSDVALAVSFSPDGTRLAAGGADNSIRIYDVASGKEQLVIQQHADWVMSVAWNHDGSKLASASRDRTARVYDTKTGDLETTYTGHQGPVFAVALSSDGKIVCSAGRDKKIRLWKAEDGKDSGEIGGPEEEIYRLIVDGDSLFSCSAEKKVRQHSLSKKEAVRDFAGHKDAVYSLALNANRKRLASGSYDGEVRIWNLDDGKSLTSFIAAPGYHAATPSERASSGE